MSEAPPATTAASPGACAPAVPWREGIGHEVLGAVGIAVVAFGSATFAHFLRKAILGAAERIGGTSSAPSAMAALHPAARFALAFAALAAAVGLATLIRRRYGENVGLHAVTATAEGADGPSVPATLGRALATVAASAGLTSIGREGAIIETGGALGNCIGRRLRHEGWPFAVTGIGAAFAAAYHAPIAAVLYVREHIGRPLSRRASITTVAGATIGALTSTSFFGSGPLFTPLQHDRTDVLKLGAVALLPATIGCRLFVTWRQRAATWVRTGGRGAQIAVLVIASGVVAAQPLAAGNGMEAIRRSATTTGVAFIAALALAKFAATSATIATGAPGGVFSPTMAVSVGWALAAFEVLPHIGIHLAASTWAGVLASMTIGIAVGLGSPIVAAVLVAEMTGDLRLIPYTAVVAAAAYGLNRGLTAVARRANRRRQRPARPGHRST